MTRALVLLAITVALAGPAAAESCDKSRDYILEGLAGDLPHPGRVYLDLYKVCMETLTFSNVKDAYVMKDGGIAIDPRRNTLTATASTLAQFCERFPRRTARFFSPREQSNPHTVGLVVMMSSASATSCPKLRGAT